MVKKLIRLNFGKTTLPETMIHSGGREGQSVPIVFSFFLLLTENKKILVDAGCDTMPGFVMTDFIGPVSALKNKGFSPANITDVIITHAHHDHIEGVKHFKNAKIHIQREEFAREGKNFIPKEFEVCLFDEKTELEGVRAVKIGGHSDGSCVIEFQLNGKKRVICGDECYTKYNIENFVPTATSHNPKMSQMFLEKYCRGDYLCILCHEE
ncbi:MAG: MBL fold metallo-hydrolase [Ruminococcaceae bacterium]|nr:MBL fold metallo-hydrolase [Oscillospiraceae bacterium]